MFSSFLLYIFLYDEVKKRTVNFLLLSVKNAGGISPPAELLLITDQSAARLKLFALSNSALISSEGSALRRDTTTMTTEEMTKAGNSS